MICNHMGTETFLDDMAWTGNHDFATAEGYVWTLNRTIDINVKSSNSSKVEPILQPIDSPANRSRTDNCDTGSDNVTGDDDYSEAVRRKRCLESQGLKTTLEKRFVLQPAGYVRGTADGRLTFIVVLGGSHMVPMDVPEAALDMVYRFVNGLSFNDYEQSIDIALTVKPKIFKALDGKEKVINAIQRFMVYCENSKFGAVYAYFVLAVMIGIAGLASFCCWKKENTSKGYERIPEGL